MLPGQSRPFRCLFFGFSLPQVPLPHPCEGGGSALLEWGGLQPPLPCLLPRAHFASRSPGGLSDAGSATAIGAARLWRGAAGESFGPAQVAGIGRFLPQGGDGRSSGLRAYGGVRFDAASPSISAEWSAFGTFYFFVPAVDLQEAEDGLVLGCNLLWAPLDEDGGGCIGHTTAAQAAQATDEALLAVRCTPEFAESCLAPLDARAFSRSHSLPEEDWVAAVDRLQAGLQPREEAGPSGGVLDAALISSLVAGARFPPAGLGGDAFPPSLGPSERGNGGLSKVVLARRTTLAVEKQLNPWAILKQLKAADPTPYRFCLQLPSGDAFVGSTPERLFSRRGAAVTSEAVAGTRPRGPAGDDRRDAELAFEMLMCPKVRRGGVLPALAFLCWILAVGDPCPSQVITCLCVSVPRAGAQRV